MSDIVITKEFKNKPSYASSEMKRALFDTNLDDISLVPLVSESKVMKSEASKNQKISAKDMLDDTIHQKAYCSLYDVAQFLKENVPHMVEEQNLMQRFTDDRRKNFDMMRSCVKELLERPESGLSKMISAQKDYLEIRKERGDFDNYSIRKSVERNGKERSVSVKVTPEQAVEHELALKVDQITEQGVSLTKQHVKEQCASIGDKSAYMKMMGIKQTMDKQETNVEKEIEVDICG